MGFRYKIAEFLLTNRRYLLIYELYCSWNEIYSVENLLLDRACSCEKRFMKLDVVSFY